MKILIVSQYYNPDPFRLHEAAEGLAADGNTVTVLTGTPNYVSKESIQKSEVLVKSGTENNVRIIRVPTFRRRGGKMSLALSYISYAFNASLRGLFLKKEYDAIFVYQLSPVLMIIPAWAVRKMQKIGIALYCLDLWPESVVGMGITHQSRLYRIMRRFSIKAYNSVDYLGYTSRMFRKYFQEDLNLKQTNYMYIPQFAEDLYSSVEPKPHEGINYVFAGNIGEAQSVETIIEAAAKLKDTKIRWHIVGDGSSLGKCRELANQLQVNDSVVFHGRQPTEKMPEYYATADALVVTLGNNEIISYTLPGKVQSYMAAGIPVLAAASGETARVIEEAECGLCSPAEDPDGLAMNARKMLTMDRKAMGENARKYYNSHYTKQQYIDSIEDMLESVL